MKRKLAFKCHHTETIPFPGSLQKLRTLRAAARKQLCGACRMAEHVATVPAPADPRIETGRPVTEQEERPC